MDESRNICQVAVECLLEEKAPVTYSLEAIMHLQKVLADGIPNELEERCPPDDQRLLSIGSSQRRDGSIIRNTDFLPSITVVYRTLRNLSHPLLNFFKRAFADTLQLVTRVRNDQSMRRGV